MPIVSVILCTRNRADSLRQTLCAFEFCEVPANHSAEILVLDNGSTDQTREVVAQARLSNFRVRHLFEPRLGKSCAFNRGLGEANGHILVSTDDDVRPTVRWLTALCEPIVANVADCVGGPVVLSSASTRPWMQAVHRSYLASSERVSESAPQDVLGANFAFSRRILERIPRFDPELGPGALGFAEEALFFQQIKVAGFRTAWAREALIYHHPDVARFDHDRWIDTAVRHGRSNAYITYHWAQLTIALPRLRQILQRLRLFTGRTLRRWSSNDREQVDARELQLVALHEYFKYYLEINGQAKNYERHGLLKLRGVGATGEASS